ncbi:hypothetical protein AB0I61_31250 [Polymorphospora rubra]|uniref:hypothetical protein n=1 Tax=Polymorphospora rubra TaxID=338584 RepID=UPI0033F428AD
MPVTHPVHDQVEDVPADVTDVLLWRLAAKVIAAHQPQPERPTRCTSLLCTGQHYPCLPVRAARRAQQISRRRPAGAPETLARVGDTGAATRGSTARPPRQGFADWYTATRTAINSGRMVSAPWAPRMHPVVDKQAIGRALVSGRGRPPLAAAGIGT